MLSKLATRMHGSDAQNMALKQLMAQWYASKGS
jgi:hypothetical protein